jgi:hypothetical protein
MKACAGLVEQAGATVAAFASELGFLEERTKLKQNDVFIIITF